MRRYYVDTNSMELESELTLYRLLLRWAAERGDHFEFGYEPTMYEHANDIERLQALGEVSRPTTSYRSAVMVRGKPSERFVAEMTRSAAPIRAVAGDVSPVDFVMIYIVERALYVSYDYGTVQTMDLTDEEVESLRQYLAHVGIESAKVVPL